MVKQFTGPNLFTFDGDAQISYSTTSINGQPQLTYQSSDNSLTFSGGDIRTQDGELGTLVSVSLIRTVDAGDTVLTLLLPGNILLEDKAQTFKTLAIITKTFGILPHQGAERVYEVLNLQGTAAFVEF